MKQTLLRSAFCASLLALAPLTTALAKLPAPSADAKAKADEAKAKTAWSDKVAAYKLCQSQDRVAAEYFKDAKAASKDVKPAGTSTPCVDPGPYTPVAAAPTPPLEAAGAHSPAKTAIQPPNAKDTAAEQAGKAKK